MTREQLRLRYVSAVRTHWRTSLDQSGPTPALLDDLVKVAQDYAEALHAREIGRAPHVAASPSAQDTPADTLPRTPRTRTRTRGGQRDDPPAG